MCLYLCAKSHAYLCVGSDQFTIITDIVIFFDWVQSIKRAILIETLFTIFFIQIYPLYIHVINIVSLEIRWKEIKEKKSSTAFSHLFTIWQRSNPQEASVISSWQKDLKVLQRLWGTTRDCFWWTPRSGMRISLSLPPESEHMTYWR